MNQPVDLPLKGIKVLDFAQFLAGPAAALRLADLGADVIKIERTGVGDLCRTLAVNDQYLGNDSLLFHTFNRNKMSVEANLKSPGDLDKVKKLITTADVMIHNFRPGVMERIGLDYEAVRALNSKLIYGSVTGYGTTGPWRDKPGQDLLAQALSGMTWLSGDKADGPVPVGLPVLDVTTGSNLVQGILAALVRRGVTGKGALVEVDLMSSAFDLQFEQLTAYFNDTKEPSRTEIAGANIYGAAPYGIYQTKDGYLAIAMTPIAKLAELLECPTLGAFSQDVAFSKRDEIKHIIAVQLKSRSNTDWLSVLEPADIWCAPVMNWKSLSQDDGFVALEPLQEIRSKDGLQAKTTRCPIRLDGRYLTALKGAPSLGENTAEFFAD